MSKAKKKPSKENSSKAAPQQSLSAATPDVKPVQAPPPPPAAQASNESDEDVVLMDAEGNRYCRVRDCDQASLVDGYCRFHYLLLWKKIQVRKKILTDGKLEYYIVELTSRYPDKFLEMIRRDLRSQKDFMAAIQELEIDESGLDNDYEEEDTQSFIDEVRGTGIGETESVEDEF